MNFTPQTGSIGTSVTIQGQNFNPTASANTVTFNGVAATVVSATASTIVATVPTSATTGPVAITVNGVTATSTDSFTVVSSPAVLSVTPKFLVSSAASTTVPSFTVTGANLTGASFSFAPALSPASITVNSATINASGTSAVLNLTVAANTVGNFTLIATNAAGASSALATQGNTLQIINPDGDADGDGITNAVEIALGSDPLNPQTSGAGIADGWQVFYGLNPLSASSAGPDPGKSGDTALQDFHQGLSPVNPNRVPPGVTQIAPANAATGIYINSVVVVRFGEPLLIGTSLAAAQNAITAVLGTGSTVPSSSQATAAATLQSYMNRTCCGNSVIPGVVTVSGPYGAITGGVTASSDGLSVTFAPSVPLTSNTTYTVQVNGVRDAAGNLMTKPFTSTFTTGATEDFSIPTIKLVDPENNSSNVPTNAHYTVQFSKAMDPASLTSSTFTILDQTTNTLIQGTIQVDPAGLTASFIPSAPLPVDRGFTVTFTTAIKDTVGNNLAASSTYYFTTGYNPETAAPHLVSNSPVSGASGIPVNAIVDLLFSQPLNITTVMPNIQVSTNGQPIPVQVALSGGDERVTITPVAGLQANVQYTVTIGPGIANIAGISVDNPGAFNFQTVGVVDKNPLTITSFTPTNSAAGVPLNVHVGVSFSKPVDVVTVSSTNVVLYPPSVGSASPVAGTITTSADAMSAVFTPQSSLLAETQYCFSVSNIVDLEGNALSGYATTCFTTGGSSQGSGPVVVGVSPGDKTVGVAVNAVVAVGLNEAVSAVSVGQSAIAVTTSGGQAVAGVVTQPSATTLLFTPSGSLAVSTSYTVTAGGFTDLAGNAATAFTSGFTTSSSSTPVKTGPTVLSVTPPSGSTNVAVTTPVAVTFSGPVNPLTVTSSSLAVLANGTVVAGTVALNAAGTVATFTPLSPLPGSATVRVYVSYYASVTDAAGNTVPSSTGTSFTTAATVDTTAPAVVMVTPSNGQTGVGLNGQVVVVFSKSMNPSTLTANTIALLAGDVRQSFGVSVSADNRTLTLYSLNLPASTVVTLALSSGALDLSGNALANYTSQFTTAPAFDTTHASVVNQRPGNGATGVLTTASPVVLFLNKALDASTISNNTVQVTQNGQLVTGTLTVVGNGQTVEFTPSSTWTYGALVQVFLDATALDTSGNAVNAYKGSFTVAGDPATTAPALVNLNPMSGATAVPLNAAIHLQYSEPLNAATLTAQNVELYSGGTVAATVTLDKTGMLLQVAPTAQLAANKQYCVYVNYFQGGLQGSNGLAVPQTGQCFTTGALTQTKAPAVVTVSPANNLANVPVNANIGVVFSGPVDPVPVTGATVALSGGGMTLVPASISFSNQNQTVRITPEAPLPASTVMTLTISGVTDVAGNAVAAQTTQFTTGTAAAIATPGVVASNPVANQTGVPVNAAISLKANAAIDGTTVNGSTFQVYDQTLNTYLSGTYSLSADGTTVYFVPATQLATGRTYTVNFDRYGMTDLAGNALTYYCSASCIGNFSFTTGFATSAAAPQVTGVSPAKSLTGVPINAQIVVSFSEPVNAETLGGVTLSVNGSPVGLGTVLSGGNQLLTITPVAGLLPSKTYTLVVAGVQDLAGNAMAAPFTSTFTTSGTVDLTPLTIVSVSPASGTAGVPLNAQVRIGFSKGVNVVSLAGGNLVLYPSSVGSSYPVTGTLTVSPDGTSVTFTPTAALLAETQYGVYVSGVVDLEGQALTGSSTSYFTTGGSSQTSGPVVVGVSPGDKTVGVPVNAVVAVGLNEAVSAVSVGQSAIAVTTSGGQAVAGVVTQPSATTLLFTPSGSLAVSTSYTVTAGGFTDLAGNAATAFTSGFTTSSSSTPVKTGPTVLSVTPPSGSTNVAVTTPVAVTFSGPVNPLTVTSSSLAVLANGTVVAGTVALNAAGTVATFTPLSPLPGSATVRVYVSYYASVTDAAGNTVPSSTGTSFTTAATVDTTAPAVVMVTPSNGQTGVGLNGQVVVVFSKSMNPSTLTANTIALLAGDVRQSFGVSVSADNRTLTLYSLNLPASTVVTLALSSGALDLSGNALANYTSQFTTAPAFDTTHASVVNQRPGNGATGVLTTASPVVLFLNKALDASTISNNTVQVTQNGQLVTGTLTVVGNGQTVEFTPSSTWTYGALVQVFLDATALDTSGNAVNAYKGSFTVAGDPATTAPALVNLNPMSGATAVPLNAAIHLQYSEPLNAATLTAQNVELYSGGTVAATVTLDKTGMLLQVAPTAQLAANKQYCVYVNYFQGGLQGSNGLAVPQTGQCFTTGALTQTKAPAVVTVSPANNLANVPVNANIGVVFSGPVDPVPVTGATVALSGGGMTLVPASISFSNQNQTVRITPEAPLPASTVMTLTISGVTDVAGNAVAAQTTQFTTGTAAAIATPGVVASNPVANQTGVPVNAAISLKANAAIDGTTVNGSTFQVYDQTLNTYLSGTYSLSADGTTVYFVPATQLATGRTYTVNFDRYGMTDLAGNALTYYCSASCIGNFSFTTGFATSAAAPQVTGVSPAKSLTGVPINAQIVVSFSEPVNAETLGGVTLSVNGSPVGLGTVLSGGNQLLTITPVAGLLPSKTYTLVVAGVQDLAGNAMAAPFTSTFTTSGTVDLTPLTIVSVSPASGTAGVPLNAQVRIGFSKGVNVVSLAGGNLVLYPSSVGSSYPVTGTLTVSPDGTSVTFTPTAALLAETQYGVYVSGVVDLEGQALTGSSTSYFTTGGSSQTSGPVVVGVSPGDKTVGVPVNAVVAVGLNEAVSAVSVGQSAIAVTTSGGQAVAGVVTQPSATTLLFTPSGSLAVSTSYTVTAGGFTDLAGNAATAFTSGFTTSSSSTPVKTGPTVLSVTPPSGSTNVAVTTPVAVTFSGPVNPLTVTSSSLAVLANGTVVAGTVALNAAGTVATFTPLSPLPGSATVRVYVSYYASVTDAAGNTVPSSTGTSFTTAATVDTTAPAVVMVTPSNGQTGVGLNGQVVVVFSKSMNPSTLTANTIALLAGDVRQSFGVSVSADNRTLTLYSLNLPASTVVTLALSSGALDLSGNALANYTSQFTTAPAFDTTHASVVNQRPGNGATGVLTTASPVVLFLNKALDASTISNNTVQVTQNGQLVTGTLTVVGNGQTVEFTPSSTWTYGALVQVFLDATALDTSGNAVNAYKGSFTVAGDPATTAPALVNLNPMSGATAVPLNAAIHLQYSEPLNAATLTAQNVELYSGGTVAATVTLDKTGMLLQVAPTAQLAANKQYCVYVNYFQGGLQGSNGLAVPQTGQCFTTGALTQTKAPAVVTVSPANNLANVPVNANIGVVFSGPVDPVPVTGATVALSGGGMTLVPASISFSNQNQTVRITPEAPLPASTVMTLTISGVTDVAGNAVAAQTTQFTTGTAAAIATPGVVASNPVANQTGVPVNAAISLKANAAIDGTTVNGSTFQVYDQTLNTYLSGTYSLSADGTTVYFVPATQLATGRTYTVNFDRYGMTDLAGNALTYYCSASCIGNFSFTTGFATSAAAPQVTGVSPAKSLTGVPINAQIVVSFSEPVNAETLGGVTLSVNGSPVGLGTVLSGGNQLLTITPVAGLLPSKTYTLVVAGVQDLAGNAMAAPFTSTFTTSGTVDLTPLTIVSVSPASGTAGVPLNAQVRIGFSKGVNVVSLAGGNLVLYPSSVGSSYPVTGTLTVSPDGTSVTFTPTAALLAETQYGVYVSGVVDLEGQALTGSSTSYFTTGGSSQTSGPVVVGVSPGDKTVGVPVNAVVAVGLNEAVSAVSVGQSAIAVTTSGGQAVAGVVTQPSATTLLFTPSGSLAVSTSYTVTAGGFTDLAGNAATAFTSGFTTSSSSTPVKTGPTVLSVTPPSGSTNVAVTTPVAVTFSGPVNPLTVTSSSLAVLANGTVVAGTVALNAAGTVATFTPLSPLPGSATVRVYVSYYASVTDAAGNTVPSSTGTSFTTAATVDTTAPAVVMVTPSNGQTGVGLNGQVVVVFSKSMNPSTLTANTIALLAGDVRQSFGVSVSADNRTLTLYSLNLPASTVVTLALSSGALDLSGNALANYTSQFTTAPAFDTTHASVVNQRPGNGATGVLTTASPVVLFLNKALDASTISNNTVQVTQNGQLVTGTLTVVGNGQTVEFTPSSTWTYGALVQVFLDATALDTSGNAVNAYKGSFTVAGDPATTAPALVNLNPMSGATAVPLNAAIHLQYSEPLNAATLTAQNVELYSGGTVAATVTLDKTGMLLQVAPTAQLAANKQYCVYVNYFQGGLQGSNGLAVPQTGQCFTTGALTQTKAPAVVTVSPANNLANVPVNANIGVVFSGPVDPVPVTGATVALSGGGMTLVPASISFSNQNQTVRITPEAPLPASTVMTLTISGVTDVAGNAVAAQTTQFTTGTAAAIATPGVVASNPVANQTGVPVNAAISLKANAAIDGTTVNGSTFQVYDQTLNTYLSGTYSLSADGTTVYFVPATQLATGRTYTVNFDRYGMTDLAGNALTYYCSASCIGNFSFTTGFATSAAAPQVTGVSPAKSLTGVPINAQIVVSFSEPVNAETLGGVTLSVNGSPVGLGTVLSGGNQLLTITPVAGLLPSKTYTLVVAGVQDLAGNAMAAPFTSTFTTSGTVDLTQPVVSSITPINMATGVQTTSTIQIQFNKLINELSINASDVSITSGGTTSVVGTISFNQNGTIAIFTPSNSLLPSTSYLIQLSSGILDLEGRTLTNFQSAFTTGIN